MLFQPSNITPSTFAGVGGGTVSPTDAVNISWQINGNSYLTKYSIAIYKANSDGSHTLVTTLTNSVNISPTDSKGNPNFCTYSSSTTWGTLLNDTTGGYAYDMQITQYWSDAESVTQFSLSRFITRAAPTLTLNVSSTVTSAYEDAYATFAQANGDTINWVRWQWAIGTVNSSNVFVPDEILEDTGEIYTIATYYSMNGLVNGNIYGLICTVETSSGVQVSTNSGDWTTFNVEIEQELDVPDEGQLVCTDAEYIEVRYNGVSISSETSTNEISGTANGDYEIIQSSEIGDSGQVLGSIALEQGATVTWNKVNSAAMSISSPYTVAMKVNWNGLLGYLLNINDGDILVSVTDAVSGVAVRIIQNGSTVANVVVARSFSGVIGFNQTSYTIGGTTGTFSTALTLSDISSIVLGGTTSGMLNCEWLWVGDGTQTLTNSMEQPDDAELFLATFDYGLSLALEAGNNITVIEEINSSVYRAENGTKKMLMQDIGRGYLSIRDFGWRACNSYQYSALVVDSDEGSYGEIEISRTAAKRQPFYLLLETEQDTDYVNSKVYHVIKTWRFGNNVEASAVSNNNTPSWLTNFTGYDLKQPSSQKGKSGTLQALLSNATSGVYADTIAQQTALFEASHSTNTFFLKDPKGNIYMVAISEPITQSVNTKSATLEVTVSLSWKEIGDASDVSLIQLPTDEGWNDASQNGD